MSVAEFHLFLELPYEIRAIIWELCLPHRVQEIEVPRNDIRWPYESCRQVSAYMANRRPPAISRVCRESRAVAMQSGQQYDAFMRALWGRFPEAPYPQKDDDTPPWRYRPVDSTRNSPAYSHFTGYSSRDDDEALWVLPGRSGLHLNYTEDYAAGGGLDWDQEQEQDPVGYLHFLARELRAPTLSISANLIFPFCENNLRLGPVCNIPNIRALRRYPSYAVVVLHVPLHLTSPTAARQSGLFGLLGDAPLQLLDPRTDWSRTEQLREVWRAHCPPNNSDRDAFRAFEVVLASQQGFLARCQSWLADLQNVWVNYFYQAIGDDGDGLREGEEDAPGFSEENKPDEGSVWTGANYWDEDDDAPTHYRVDLATRSLNLENPWVQAHLVQMPMFVPHILFRYCDAKCYLPEEERPARPVR